MRLSFVQLPVISALFQYELKTIEKKIPYTGRIIDARSFVVNTAIAVILCIVSVVTLTLIIATITGIHYLYLAILSPLLIPLAVPILLGMMINDRNAKSASEFLAFVTYAGIMHTVQKTMFWTMQSVCSSAMFTQLRVDSQIVLRYAKGGRRRRGTLYHTYGTIPSKPQAKRVSRKVRLV